MAYKIYQQLESGMAGKGLINANAVDAVSKDGSIKPLPQVLDELGGGDYVAVATITERDAISSPKDGLVCYVNEEREEYRYNASKSQWYEIDKTFNSTEWDELGEEGQQEALGLYTNIYVTEE